MWRRILESDIEPEGSELQHSFLPQHQLSRSIDEIRHGRMRHFRPFRTASRAGCCRCSNACWIDPIPLRYVHSEMLSSCARLARVFDVQRRQPLKMDDSEIGSEYHRTPHGDHVVQVDPMDSWIKWQVGPPDSGSRQWQSPSVGPVHTIPTGASKRPPRNAGSSQPVAREST